MEYTLKRQVNHDERSKLFAFDTSGLEIIDVEHKRLIPVLDQGQIGSCTGNAGIGAVNTEPFPLNTNVFSPDEAGALKLYEAAQVIDGVAPYPATDNGSSGLSIAKALKNAGIISGYQHTFTLNDALKALSKYTIISGINWFDTMFTPDADGRVHPQGIIKGGHEVEGYKVDVENGRIYFFNSWGTNWGQNGTFYLTWEDFANLLSQQGDVTVLFPITITPPTPAPVQTLRTATIERLPSDKKQTVGHLFSDDEKFGCVTLELPDLNNQNNISCIPKGAYKCVYSYMADLKEWHYELQGVPGRSGIFIHEGNYYTNTKGCILLGWMLIDINFDGERDAIMSKRTVDQFETFFEKKPINLIIK